MKEYWTIRLSNTCGETVRLISVDGHQFSSKGMWVIFKSAVSAKAALWTVRAREVEFCPESRNKFILCHHTVKAKPRGAKVGTWAWACEQMLAGKAVRRPEWGVRRMVSLASLHGFEQQLCVRTIRNDGWEPDVPRVSDFQATNWQVAP